MAQVSKSKTLPAGSIAAEGFGRIDYMDIYSIRLPAQESVDRLIFEIFSCPDWVNALMKIRNRIVRLFGLQISDGVPRQADHYPVGSRAALFTVLARNEHEIVTGEDDKHLNFRGAVHVDPLTNRVSLITLVHCHNAGGQLYFALIKPFHCLILRTQMKRL